MRRLVCCLVIAGVVACTAYASAREPRITIPGDDWPGCRTGDVNNSLVNQYGVAWLSWTADPEVVASDLNYMPMGLRYLYVQLAYVQELAGCELSVRWTPPSSQSAGCYGLIGIFSPEGPQQLDPDPGSPGGGKYGVSESVLQCGCDYWREVFVWGTCLRNCTTGPVSRALFNFTNCSTGVQGQFHLEYCRVTDCDGRIADLDIIGDATILGGAALSAPVPTEPVTWGAVKLLYAAR